MQANLSYRPQPKQKILHTTHFDINGVTHKIRQILYGGAAGGGKSHAMRWDAIICCLKNPGCDAYLFRKSRTDLENTHIKRIKQEIPDALGKYSENRNRFEFKNGSYLNMMYAEHEKDVYKYDSVEFHWLGIDEAGHFTRDQLAYLKTRVRTGSWRPQEDIFPRMLYSANPGGVSHTYLQNTFMKGRKEERIVVWDDDEEEEVTCSVHPFIDENGHPTLFIPASMDDNRYLDDDYENQFNDIPEWKRKQLVDGDWDVIPGAFFSCWDARRHAIRPFRVPEYWTKFRAVDWGFSTPFWIGEFAVSDGEPVLNTAGETVTFPKDAIICIWEWYGSKGETRKGRAVVNDGIYGMGLKGIKTDAGDVAKRVVKLRGKCNYSVGGHDMWRSDSGPSAAEKFFRAGMPVSQADYKREAGWQHMFSMINHDMFYVFDTCPALIGCIPILETDQNNPEDIEKKGEDHPGDGCRYGLMSRPAVTEEPPEPEKPYYIPTINDLMKQNRRPRGYKDRARI